LACSRSASLRSLQSGMNTTCASSLLLCSFILTLHAAAETDTPTAPPHRLPPQPWHVADVWWSFAEPTPHFESLEMT
jgi:hypothetical protein